MGPCTPTATLHPFPPACPGPLPAAQIKALDAEAVEAQPHKGAVEAADEIRGLLDGSRQVNGKKAGAGSVAALNAAPQVCGREMGQGAALGSAMDLAWARAGGRL